MHVCVCVCVSACACVSAYVCVCVLMQWWQQGTKERKEKERKKKKSQERPWWIILNAKAVIFWSCAIHHSHPGLPRAQRELVIKAKMPDYAWLSTITGLLPAKFRGHSPGLGEPHLPQYLTYIYSVRTSSFKIPGHE